MLATLLVKSCKCRLYDFIDAFCVVSEQSLCNGRASVCLSVCLSDLSTAATEAGGFFAADCRVPCEQEVSIDSCGRSAATAPQHGAQQQMRAASRLQPRTELV